ncbi:MAG: hypothetical protein KAT90_04850 [Gammaproteobacteria bacterium]|nr:hypothetical protein [Gammaproteobacteria bacterium]
MAHTRNTENEKVTDRRMVVLDRRENKERRNQLRLSLMKDECRDDVPRRHSDMVSSTIEGETWWNRQQLF